MNRKHVPTEGDQALEEARAISQRRAQRERDIDSMVSRLEHDVQTREDRNNGTVVHRPG